MITELRVNTIYGPNLVTAPYEAVFLFIGIIFSSNEMVCKQIDLFGKESNDLERKSNQSKKQSLAR